MRQRQEHDPADEEERLPRELRDVRAHHRLEHGGVARQPARQLAGAPLGEEARREAHEIGEEVDAQPRDDALGGGGEEKDLDEVERGLHGEEPEQAERDAVEPRGAPVGEGGIEQVPDDLREGEPDRAGSEQADARDREPAGVRPDARKEAHERTRRRQAAGRLARLGGGRRHGPATCRSTTIAAKSRAR